MTDDASTHLQHARARRPLLSLLLEVVDGPDSGRIERLTEGDVSIGTASTNAIVLTDPTVSRFHAELGIRGGQIVVSDPGSTNGTRIGPVVLRGGRATLDAGTTLSLGDTVLRIDVVEEDAGPMPPQPPFGELWSNAPSMRQPLKDLARVAGSDVAVLLQGESGTGKELAARAIHDHSPRADEPFVTVDCGAIAPQLVASQLFGHERGAFTGADRRRIGAFEQAGRGTVFLDEVGELGPDMQAMLLGVLERRRFSRVGSHEPIEVGMRVVSATHRDLRAAVNAGTFRLDLYYRLAAVRVVLPPLRERIDDLRPLVSRFLQELGSDRSLEDVFDHEALVAMERHPWPGNVRELRNIVTSTLALGRAMPPEPPALGPASAEIDPSALDALDYKTAKREVLDRFERRYFERLLARVNGSVRAASREAKLERNHLSELLRRHGLGPRSG